MEEVTDSNLYEYSTEVIVELMGVDGNGEIAIVSYQFTFDDKESVVHPKGKLAGRHEAHVEKALADAGYNLNVR